MQPADAHQRVVGEPVRDLASAPKPFLGRRELDIAPSSTSFPPGASVLRWHLLPGRALRKPFAVLTSAFRAEHSLPPLAHCRTTLLEVSGDVRSPLDRLSWATHLLTVILGYSVAFCQQPSLIIQFPDLAGLLVPSQSGPAWNQSLKGSCLDFEAVPLISL